MISIERLSKSFKGRKGVKKVLDNVSFEAFDGEVFGLLGPNGAGKTTTLRTIATLLQPDSGKVSVDGFDVTKEGRAVRNRIGFLTGDMKLAGNLSSREMLRFYGELNHMPSSQVEARILQLSADLGMDDFLDRPISKLSAGMTQKTSIAVSILHDPQVIVFDEPTSNLDVLAVKVVADFIRESKARGKCVVLSTHVLSEAERLCDRVGILHQGQLLCRGSHDELLAQYGQKSLEDLFFHLVSKGSEVK
jgi:sodium transport system ATP-binding protein